jgi:hypothetical protein
MKKEESKYGKSKENKEGKSMRMKKSIVLVIVLFLFFAWPNFFHQALGQTRARTEKGENVILYPDGTWKYVTGSALASKYIKPASAQKLFRTDRGNFGIWYDEKKWVAPKKPDEERWLFSLIYGDAYVVVIPEEIKIPVTSLKKFLLERLKGSKASGVKVVFEENRVVNSREVLCLKIDLTLEGIEVRYYGYLYGGEEGTIQVLAYTGQSIFDKYQQELTNFLNGLVVNPTK